MGLAWKAVDTDAMKWTIEGGPGYKIDEVRATLVDPAEREDSFGARAGSRSDYAFSDAVTLPNNTQILHSQTSTQISNVISLTANLWGNLKARVSLDVRHDTDPLPGFEAADTATKFSLICKLG